MNGLRSSPRAPSGMLATLLLMLAAGGRALLDLQIGVFAGEAWQRGIEVLTGASPSASPASSRPDDPPRRPWASSRGDHGDRRAGPPRQPPRPRGRRHQARPPDHHRQLLHRRTPRRLRPRARQLRAAVRAHRATTAARAPPFVGAARPQRPRRARLQHLRGAGARPPDHLGAWVAAAATVVSTLCDAFVFAGGLYLVWLVRPLLGGSLARPYLLLAVAAGRVPRRRHPAGRRRRDHPDRARRHRLSTLLPKWLGCLAYACLALTSASQLALLHSLRR
jgi:hypothetical protein